MKTTGFVMEKRVKRGVAICIALIVLLGMNVQYVKAVEGPADQVSVAAEITSTDPTLCERELQGQVDFTLPFMETYVDIIFIQDASGSFTNTMGDVKTSLKHMVGNLDLGTEANGYPKDRAMVVTFQGSHGFGISFNDRPMAFEDYHNYFGYKITSTPLTTDASVLNTAIDGIKPLGATPTIDGMARAQEDYTSAISGDNPYDNTFYTNNGEVRQRQTIYFLITDGVANSGYYENFPEGHKPVDQQPVPANDHPWTWVYEEMGRHYFQLYWNDPNTTVSEYTYNYADTDGNVKTENYRTFTDALGKQYYLMNPDIPMPTNYHAGPLFMYEKNNMGNIVMSSVTYDPWEHFPKMVAATVAKADEMKTLGGLPVDENQTTGPAWFVAAYWEDMNRFISGKLNGMMYVSQVQPVVYQGMNQMATDPDWFVKHEEGEDVSDFHEKLVNAFHDVMLEQQKGNLSIKLDPRVMADSSQQSLRYIKEDGTWENIDITDRLTQEGDDIYLSLDALPGGDYQFRFKMTEEEYIDKDYAPMKEVLVEQIHSNGEPVGVKLNEAKGNVPVIEANPNADCAKKSNPQVTPAEPEKTEDVAGTVEKKSPRTGDEQSMFGGVLLLVIGGATMACIILQKRRYNIH